MCSGSYWETGSAAEVAAVTDPETLMVLAVLLRTVVTTAVLFVAGYFVMRAAVRNGVMEAHERMASKDGSAKDER